jgi:uncharacterized protein YfaS (alpha-2-macroglobulin family)
VTRELVWVTSAQTGKPLANVPVEKLGNNDKPKMTVRTDRSGVAVFPLKGEGYGNDVMVDDGKHFGLALTGWQANLPANYAVDQSADGAYIPPPNGGYIYTDRSVYRPGQTVHFRGVIWNQGNGVYSLFGRKTVTVSANGASGPPLYKARLTLDRFGSIHGEFRLPPNAATGYGYLNVFFPGPTKYGTTTTVGFSIAEYRKPEFLTTVTTDQPSYVQGQTIDATVSVRYVFGAPVAGQQVSWTAFRQPLLTPPSDWDTYQFGDQDAVQRAFLPPGVGGPPTGQFGAQIKTGAATTNDQGEATIKLPVDIAKQGIDQTITIEATATDVNHQPVSGRVRVPARLSDLAIGLLPAAQVAPTDQKQLVGVASVTPSGAPLPHTSLTATIYRRTFTSEYSGNGFASPSWKQVPHDTQVTTRSIKTDARGQGSFSFTPTQGGAYYLVVQGTSAGGTAARSALTVYASTAGFSDWGPSNNTVISLKPDRSQYRVGQTAHILVAAPFAHAEALITLERSDISRHWVQALPTNSSTIDVPITLADLPNIFVGVTVYRGWRKGSPPDWRTGAVNLKVSVDPKLLKVKVSQNRSRYHPGEQVTYTITTTDVKGRPVSAQVSLALVDTAVLALLSDQSLPILTALYGPSPDTIQTFSQGVISIDHLQQRPNFRVLPPGGLGGGGGGGPPTVTGALLPSQKGTKVRKVFKDTAYWFAHVVTNASGKATVTVTLPDNLTTWQLSVRGITANQQVGQATLDTFSTQDLIIRPVTPRFLLEGDSLQVGAVVNNNIDQAVDADLSIAPSGLAIQGLAARRVSIPAHGEKLVTWRATVPPGQQAVLTYRLTPTTSDVQGDAVQVTIPVHEPLTGETVATSGEVFGSIKQAVIVPASAQRQPGALTVQVAASLTAGMGRALDTFQPTPYDSNDDIAARVMAAAALHSVPASLSGLSVEQYNDLPSVMQKDIARLVANQQRDGGWAWFPGPNQKSDMTVTSDVAMAFAEAGGKGVPPSTVAKVDDYLPKFASCNPTAQSIYASLAHAKLLKAAPPAPSNSTELVACPSGYLQDVLKLDPASVADVAWTFQGGGHSEAMTLVSALDSRAMISATGAHWEGGNQSAVYATAHVLNALLQVSPNDPFVAASARWLMLARDGSAWDSSRDSAQALSALTAYARAAKEGKASYRYAVQLNGATELSGRYTNATVRQASSAVLPLKMLGQAKRNSLMVARQPVNGNLGTGPFYYVAQLQYYLQARNIAARNQGISVSRRYLDLSNNPIDSAPAGSVVQVQLTITTGQTLSHLEIDDPIPSGFEPIDQSLNTSQQGLFPGWQLPQPAPGTQNLGFFLDRTDLRDDRVSLFATSLLPGTYTYSYLTTATTSGTYGVAPTHATEAFFPEVFGRSAGQDFVVK